MFTKTFYPSLWNVRIDALEYVALTHKPWNLIGLAQQRVFFPPHQSLNQGWTSHGGRKAGLECPLLWECMNNPAPSWLAAVPAQRVLFNVIAKEKKARCWHPALQCLDIEVTRDVTSAHTQLCASRNPAALKCRGWKERFWMLGMERRPRNGRAAVDFMTEANNSSSTNVAITQTFTSLC